MGDPGTLNLVQWQCMLDKGYLAMLQDDNIVLVATSTYQLMALTCNIETVKFYIGRPFHISHEPVFYCV